MEDNYGSRSSKFDSERNRYDSSDRDRKRDRNRRSPDRKRRDHSSLYDNRRKSFVDEKRYEYNSEDRPRERQELEYENNKFDKRRSQDERHDRSRSGNDRSISYDRNKDYNTSESSHSRVRDVENHNKVDNDASPYRGDHRPSEFNRPYSLDRSLGKSVEEDFIKNNGHDSNMSWGSDPYNSMERETHFYKSKEERHISFKNTSVTNEDDFVASLLQKIDFLTDQVEFFQQENKSLKHLLNSQNDEQAAEVSIKFNNKKFEDKFLPILKEIATDLITGRCSIEALTDFLQDSNLNQNQSESWNAEGELFSLDISCDEPKESSSVPRYDSSFNQMMETPDKQPKEKVDANKSSSHKKFAKVCFNCGADHVISKCPHPLDQRKIASARRQYQSTPTLSNKRYHVAEKQESNFKPGVISDELREALGLEKHQIPMYIYRMRILDYPPGWMAEAEIESSGIKLYDSEDVAESNVNEDKKENEVRYDTKKLIDYPGFNAPLPPDVVDESSSLGLPPRQDFQSRDIIEQALPKTEPPPSRKRKLVLPPPKNTKSIRLEESMEVDYALEPTVLEFNPPLPDEDQNLPPPPPPDEDQPPPPQEDSPEENLSADSEFVAISEENSPLLDTSPSKFNHLIEPFKMGEDQSQSSGNESLSLIDLEEMKKRLEMELNSAADSSNSTLLESSDKQTNGSAVDENPSSTLETDEEHNKELSNPEGDNSLSLDKSVSNDDRPSLQRTESLGSKFVAFGTPSISRHSSFTKLPSYDNFSKNVTEHLNFENLPDSTGAFQKMRKVIKKVKAKLNDLISQ